MIKAVIFDCFGVIITDTLKTTCRQLRQTDPAKADLIKRVITDTNKGLISAEVCDSKIAKILNISDVEYQVRIKNNEVKDQQILDYIAGLRPKYQTALLSNISTGGLYRRFTAEDLTKYFDVVVSSGDISFAKPEAQAYEITADKLGVRLNECIMIDDLEAYCLGARGVGMQAIQYQSFDQMKLDLQLLLQN